VLYRIEFKPSAARSLGKLPEQVQKRMAVKVSALAKNPRPPGVEKLSGAESLYRIRIGDYRIIYEIQDQVLLVLVVKVGHRGEIYR
jgi:mRNA interferase RelE/StbE